MTTAQVSDGLVKLKIIADTIRETRQIESSKLYAFCIEFLSWSEYQSIIRILEKSGLVEEIKFTLIWKGGK